jgi:hypothetical protein
VVSVLSQETMPPRLIHVSGYMNQSSESTVCTALVWVWPHSTGLAAADGE